MTDKHLGLFSGRAGSEALVKNAIADEAVYIGDPVIYVAGAAGERDARVEPNNPALGAAAAVAGVAVDGDQKGLYDDGARGASELVANAGETIKLVTKGRCKCRVDGSTSAISVGSDLQLKAEDGVARVASAGGTVFARALQASTGYLDFILVEVDIIGVL